MNFAVMNSRVILLAVSAGLACWLGFWAVPGDVALGWIRNYGYWVMLGTTAWFAWAVIRVLRRWPRPRAEARRFDGWGWAVVVAATWLLTVHEPFGFKIVMDEILLLGTSMSMHLDRLVQVPYRAHDIQGVFLIMDGAVDKRPLFFPFLLSLLHDFLGYRPANAWVLNVGLTGGFMALVFGLGRRLLGRLAGVVGVVLLAGLPLLAQNANGGGFEVLNLVMILVCVGLGIRMLETKEAPEVAAFCLGTVLLAQVRYESALFVLPAGILILLMWWRERRWVLPPALVATPLLLLPVPLLQKIFLVREDAWQLASKPEMAAPFSLTYVFENMAHNWGFFFARDELQPNSWLLSAVGLLALAFLVLHFIRVPRRWASMAAAEQCLTVYAAALLGLFGLLMGYFWGRFDEPVIARLSLPVHLLFVLALWLVIPRFPRPERWWVGLLGLATAQLWFWSLPATAHHAYTLGYTPGREVAWRQEFMREQATDDYLVIDPNSAVWITHGVSGVPPLDASQRLDAMAFNFRNRSFREIYVFQHFDVEPATGALQLRTDYDPGPAFVLETVKERRLGILKLSRISRVIDIVHPIPAGREAGDAASAPTIGREEGGRDELRQAYREQWLRNLP